MIKKYIEKEYDLEAVKVDLRNIRDCSKWLSDNEVAHQTYVSYIMFGKPISQVVVNVGEYLVKGLGGQFTVAPAELFELCFTEKPVKTKAAPKSKK